MTRNASTKGGACEYWTGQVEATFYGNPSYRISPGAVPKPYKPVKSEESKADAKPAPARSAPAVPAAITVTPATSGGVTYGKRKTTFILNPSLASADVGYVPGKSDDKQKKGVKSAEGQTALRTHNLNWKPRRPKSKPKRDWDDMSALTEYTVKPKVMEPEYLGSLTLKYCSAVGLIHAGILDKPPNWDTERLKLACSAQTKQEKRHCSHHARYKYLDIYSLLDELILYFYATNNF